MRTQDKSLITITMTTREQERYHIIRRLIQKEIVAKEASTQLHLTVRQVQRIKKRVKKSGVDGVIHRNRGKPSNRRIDTRVIRKAKKTITKNYADFGPTLACEKLNERDHIALSVSRVRTLMIAAELWKPKPRRANRQYHAWRPRKEEYGEMIQFDGSYHNWFEGRADAQEQCLLAGIDDATGKPILLFAANEGIESVYTYWKGYVEEHGKPISIYLDKYSTYKINHPSAVDNSELLTQFQRAMHSLDIRLIVAHSPQAKGRVERLFETLQDRLVKELRLHNISSIEEANVFLRKTFIPAFNQKFSVVPAKKGNLHRTLTKTETQRLDAIFAVHSQRRVNNDFTLSFKNQWLQLSEIQPTTVYKRDAVDIEERLDGTIHIRLNEHYLHYTVLPARPQKASTIINVPLPALTTHQSPWKPPADHPWRRQIHTEVQQRIVARAAA